MREIKFRAFEKDSDLEGAKGFVYGSLTVWKDMAFIIENTPAASNILIDKNTVGQYTGLKDKNGKEIYEGDIIRDGFDAIHAVEYIGSGFWLQNRKGDNFMPSEPNREVIGNIYEHSSLLNSKN